eukprot:2400641-Rhodomonas_salina.2
MPRTIAGMRRNITGMRRTIAGPTRLSSPMTTSGGDCDRTDFADTLPSTLLSPPRTLLSGPSAPADPLGCRSCSGSGF